MISAEQARKNVEQFCASEQARKEEQATKFVESYVEPAIRQASMLGKCELVVTISDNLDVIPEIIGIITGAGFDVKHGRADCEIHIIW